MNKNQIKIKFIKKIKVKIRFLLTKIKIKKFNYQLMTKKL